MSRTPPAVPAPTPRSPQKQRPCPRVAAVRFSGYTVRSDKEDDVKALFILNDPPYGTERTYNGIRLANNLLKASESAEVTVFLMGDAVVAANAGQQTPNGYYNLERMLKGLLARGAKVLLCGTCMDARGIQEEDLVEGSRRSSMDELAEATIAAEKVLVF